MAEVLVVVEASAAAGVKKVTLEMLTIARTLGSPSAVVFGSVDTAKLAEFGAARVYTVDDPEVEKYLVAPKATVLANLVKEKQPFAVLIASTQEGKEIAGRLAVKLDNGLLVDAVDVAEDGTATQAVFAGSTIVKSKVTKGIPLITIRPNSVTPEPAASHGAAHHFAGGFQKQSFSDAARQAFADGGRQISSRGARPGFDERQGDLVGERRAVAFAEPFRRRLGRVTVV